MALADTANLVVMLKLDDKFSGPLRGVNRRLSDFVQTSTARGGLENIGAGLGLGLKRSAIVGGVALAGISTQIAAGIRSLHDLEEVNAQTAAVIASTGGVAGITPKEVRDLAEEYETLGGILDDKVIQAGANLLLTFRNVREDVFQPALEAALDMSTALDQDLQTSVMQIGKALQDPIRGMQALRRAGVVLTSEQEEEIRDLVDAGKDVEAQQIILTELNEEFGGSFEAAGQTGEATLGRFHDSIEGLQQNLATAFLPALDKVARRLTEVFADPEVQKQVKDFGDTLAGLFSDENLDTAGDIIKDVFGFLGTIPWEAIGSGLSITAAAAKKAVDVFNSLPPGVQNALITLLAANTLTGGLVAKGLAELAGVALKSLTTIMAGNVTVVGKNIVGGGPSSPASPTPTRGGFTIGRFLGLTSAGVLGGIIGAEIGNALIDPMIEPARNFFNTKATEALTGSLPEMKRALQVIEDEMFALNDGQRGLPEEMAYVFDVGGLRTNLEEQRDALREAIRQREEIAARITEKGQQTRDAILSGNSGTGQRLARIISQQDNLQSFGRRTASAAEITARKNFSPRFTANVGVNVSTSVSAANVVTQTASYNYSIGGSNDGGSFLN